MVKNIKRAILFFIAYAVIFWVGFRSGEIYNRMQNKVNIEKVVVPVKPTQKMRLFYIVEERDYGTSRYVEFNRVDENNVIMKLFFNKKLRHLLKLRKLKIYTTEGERIY